MTFINPVANGADPFVLKEGDTYYLYATGAQSNHGYSVYTSKNLVEWEAHGFCLHRDDVYTDAEKAQAHGGAYGFWAPEVFRDGDTYYLICTAQERLQVATARSPLGPFTNRTEGYLFPFRSIDGHFFRDDDGKVYLYFVGVGRIASGGDAVDGGNNIWAAPFDLATLRPTAEPRLMVEYDRGQGHVVAEGPEMLKHGGKYYLTYSSYDFRSPAYSICYATADSPLGPFVKYEGNPILQTDDIARADAKEPHLYGTGHHSFTTSPDDSELIAVYHAHRSGTAPAGTEDYVGERRVCVDRAWFDADGILHIGSLRDGVPTATAQPLPSGGTLARKAHLDGVFAPLDTLPTVYVAWKDGLDTNDGSAAAPFRTLEAAYAALPVGGTVLLTQTYETGECCVLPRANGPIRIAGTFGAVPFGFRRITVQSDTYFDNIVFLPRSETEAPIDHGTASLVMGEGVSCLAVLQGDAFPVIRGEKSAERILGGTWERC